MQLLQDKPDTQGDTFGIAAAGFYPRDAMLARVFAIATCLSVRPSVRPSVRLSVTRRYCV